MAFTKKYLNEMFGTVLVLSALLSTVSAVDCHGKSFHCVNSTHFMICVDIGGGVSQAIDNFLVGCPPPTVCQGTNHFECEFPAPTIPSTTLSNVMSEFTQPWEEVVTVSSTGNTTKEFSENYMNTERITTTTEYSATTVTTVDLTTATESELYGINKLNIPEIAPTLAAEIATSAITQTLNENRNITEFVPPEVTVETVIQSSAESKNLTETGAVIIDEITKPVAETTTENIIITETVAAENGYKQRLEPIAAEQVPQTIYENMNITGTEPTVVAIDTTNTIIETETQSTVESVNLTETEHVIVDEFTAMTTEITTENIIITGPLETELGYIESTATEQITLTTNDNLLGLETVQAKTKPPEVTILFQHESATANILSKEPAKMQHKNPLNTEKRISNTANNITASNLYKVSISKTKNVSKMDSFAQNILPDQPTDTLETIVKTATGTGSIAHLTTIPVDSVTDDLITAPSLDTTIKKSESVNVTEPSKPASSFVRSLKSNSSVVGNKQSVAKKIENEETIMPTINDPKTQYNSVATRNRTEKVASITKERDVGWNINSATLPVIVRTDVPLDHDATENNLYTAADKSLNENKYSTVNNAPTEKMLIITTYTHNPEEATVLDGTLTETIDNGVTTEQPTTINEGSLTTNTVQNLVTEYTIVPTRQAVNLEVLTTDLEPTTASDIQSIPPAFEHNMNNDAHIPVNKNIISTVNNRDSTNGLMTVDSVNKDTITTEVVDIPTTISTAQPVTAFEDNMMIETSLPVTENILSTVNNEGSTNIFIAVQAVNMDTITTEALDIPTTVSNSHTTPPTFEDNMNIEISLNVAENIVSTVNNGVSTNGFTEDPLPTTENIVSSINNGDNTNGFMTSQSINVDELNTINEGSLTTDIIQNFVTENVIVPKIQAVNFEILTTDLASTTVSDIQSIPPAFENNMHNDAQLSVNKNIISTVNNRDSTNDFMTVESVNKDSVTTEIVDIPTTISNAQPVTPFEDNMIIETSLPVPENILSTVNNEVSTNMFIAAQAVNMDTITTEDLDIPTTVSNAHTTTPTFEDNMKIEIISLPVPENILSTVNNKGSTNIFIAAQAVNMDTITTEALDIPTTVSNAHTTPSTFEDNMKIEISLPVTENILSTLNDGVSTNGFKTAQVNINTITTKAIGIPTAISNTQLLLPAVKDSIKTEALFGNALAATTENIVLKENNEVDKNDPINGQASDLNMISTDASYLPTTVTNGQTLTFIDIMKTVDPLPTTENIVSSINNGDNTNGFMTSQSIKVDELNTISKGSLTTDVIQNPVTEHVIVPTRQAVNIEILTTDLAPTTVSDIQSIPPAFEHNMNNDAQLSVFKNIISTVNNRDITKGLTTVESVNKDTITTEVVDIPTTISNPQPVTPFEDNMIIETSLPVPENILPTVNNEGSTNIFIAAQAVNMDTITTEDLDIPTTVSNAHTTPPTFEDNMKIEIISLPVPENILSTVNNKGSTNIFIAAQAVNMDTITTEALDIPTTVSNAHTTPPTFEDNMKIEMSLPVTENIVSTVNDGVSTNGFMTAQAVNINTITTKAVGIPTAISNTQSMLPPVKDNIKTEALFGNALATTTENIVLKENNEVDKNHPINGQASDLNIISTDAIHLPTTVTNGQTLAFIDIMKTVDPLPTTDNIVSSINNRDNTNEFMTSQSIKIDEVNTEVMYGIYTTISNAQPMRPTFGDDITTDTLLTTTGDIVSSVNYGVRTNYSTAAQPVSVDKVNTEPTHIPTTSPKGPVEHNMTVDAPLPATENILSSANNAISPNGGMTTAAVNVDMINTQAKINKAPEMAPTFDDSTWTEPPLSATKNTVSAINNGVTANDVTTQKAGLETGVQLTTETYAGPSSKVIKLSLDNENAAETVHGDTIRAEGGSSVPEIIKGSPNNAIQNIQTIIYSWANAAVDNAATSQKEASATRATTRTSIPTFGFDSAFYNSNQNLMNPKVDSKRVQVNNNFQSSTIERHQADNIIWNPLAKQVFNNLNQNSESIGRGSNDILTTNSYSANIDKVKSGHETHYQPNIQSDIPVTISFHEQTDKLATAGVDVSSVSTTLPANTSVADTTILDSLNPHEPMHNSSSPSSGSSVVDTYVTLMKAGSNAEVFLGHKDNIYAKSNQDPFITSTSIKSDNISEVKSSVIIVGNIDSPTVLHNNENKLPTSSYGFSKTTEVGTPMKGKKINEERRDDTLSKPVMLHVLPLPIHNNQLNVPAMNIPAIMDFVPKSQAKNTVIITESYKTATSRPTFVETKIQNSVKVPTVTKIEDPAFNFQIGVSDKTGDTTTFPAVGSSTSNSQTSVFAKTVARNGDATFNLQTKSINEANVLSQPSHVEKILNKNTSAPNNAHVIHDTKPGGSGTNKGNPHNIHTTTTSYNVKIGIIAPETEWSYDSQKSVNLTPEETVSSGLYQNSKSTVVTDLKSASLNIGGSDKIQSEVTHQNNSSTNITSSLSTQTQNTSTSTARTPSQMVTPNTISQVNNNRNKQVSTDAAQTFACIKGARGRYSDKDDCRKFYICIGNNEPIVGYCPEPSVFSDLKKLCTKNMSHCIRENQFKCPSAGRFSDFTKDNVYYICINHKSKLYRFKFQCQKGYILDKTTVHCIETKEIESNESVSISSSDNSSQTSSSTRSKSISTSSKSNNSKKLDNSSSNNDNSSKSKKSNEAVEMTEKSEGNDDDDDDDDHEVFKCKKEGKFPIRNECRRYYLCKKNRKSEYRRKIKKCNSGKVFHKDKKKCVDDDSYEC